MSTPEAESPDAVDALPLFPLRAVLFPGTTIALRVFETRYLDMVRRCLRASTPFGIVAIRRGGEVGEAETYRTGTLARIVDWTTTRDGLLGIEVKGSSRFTFERIERAADGLYVAHGVELKHDEPQTLTAGQSWAAELLESLLSARPKDGRVAREDSRVDDANAVCWNLAMRLPLGLAERQAVLETDAVPARLERLRNDAAVLLEKADKEKIGE